MEQLSNIPAIESICLGFVVGFVLFCFLRGVCLFLCFHSEKLFVCFDFQGNDNEKCGLTLFVVSHIAKLCLLYLPFRHL